MMFDKCEWLGQWQSFETYIDSTHPALRRAWQTVQAQAALPGGDPAAFWRAACHTAGAAGAPVEGWQITAVPEGLHIQWNGPHNTVLGQAVYRLTETVEKGLEGKENLLFFAQSAAPDWPFRCVLAMPPMPARNARVQGGLLSHLHFQFAPCKELLLQPKGLCRPHWYPTMCDADGTVLEKCNIVLALHRLPQWAAIPAEE